MTQYDITLFVSVRAKVEGVEATTHEQAAERAEQWADSRLGSFLSRDGNGHSDGSEPVLTYTEMDEGEPPIAYIVDVRGDTEYDQTRCLERNRISDTSELIELSEKRQTEKALSLTQKLAKVGMLGEAGSGHTLSDLISEAMEISGMSPEQAGTVTTRTGEVMSQYEAAHARRFERFKSQRRDLATLIEQGHEAAIQYAEIAPPETQVLAYHDDEGNPKGFIELGRDQYSYYLTVGNEQHEGRNPQGLAALEQVLFDYMVSEGMISIQ